MINHKSAVKNMTEHGLIWSQHTLYFFDEGVCKGQASLLTMDGLWVCVEKLTMCCFEGNIF